MKITSLCLAILSMHSGFAQPVPAVRITPPGKSGAGIATNRFGQVAGFYYLDQQTLVDFIWQNGVLTYTLFPPSFTLPYPVAINDNGTVLIQALPVASLWNGQTVSALPAARIDGTFTSAQTNALSLNNNTTVVGCVGRSLQIPLFEYQVQQNALMWQGTSTPQIFATDIPGVNGPCGVAINNSGQVAVNTFRYTQGGVSDAYLWERGKLPRKVGTLGGTYTLATSINDVGQIAGYSSIDTTLTNARAFLWTDGVLQDLGTPLGTSRSYGLSVDSMGRVLVTADTNGTFSLWVWKSGVYTQLGDSGLFTNNGQFTGTITSIGAGALVAGQCATDRAGCVWNVP